MKPGGARLTSADEHQVPGYPEGWGGAETDYKGVQWNRLGDGNSLCFDGDGGYVDKTVTKIHHIVR